jgi:RNA polymerase sigma-70 factor (ECF subfamily)
MVVVEYNVVGGEAESEQGHTPRPNKIAANPSVRVPFDAIMKQSGMIHTLLRRLVVAPCDRPDVIQEILLSAWCSVETGRFRPSPYLPMKEALRRWLSAVAWHHVFRYRERMNRWYSEYAASTAPGIASHAPSPLGQVEARLALRDLERLTPELRAVLAGTALGYSCKEIAAELGGNPLATNRRMHRGRRQLRKVLG